jgi:hypothetical protein
MGGEKSGNKDGGDEQANKDEIEGRRNGKKTTRKHRKKENGQ